MIPKCPGNKGFSQPEPEIMQCACGYEVEIWTDEVKAVCPKCKTSLLRQQGQSCLDWCGKAKECVGPELYKKFSQNKTESLKQKLLEELKQYFGQDLKRINHAEKVMMYAEELLRSEKGDWHIVIPVSILHDVGIKLAEAKYGSPAGKYQQELGPEVAKGILRKYNLRPQEIEEICQIIAFHHTPGKINTQNFKILYDADWLVNIKDETGVNDKLKLGKFIERVFLTETGKNLARKIYLGEQTNG